MVFIHIDLVAVGKLNGSLGETVAVLRDSLSPIAFIYLIMPREIITVQVGQCGNQIGLRFWELALKEHALQKSAIYDDALSSFFRNVDSRKGQDLTPGSQITDLKARAIVVDMECGVINNKILNGELKDIFESH